MRLLRSKIPTARLLMKKASGWAPEVPKFPELRQGSSVPYRPRGPDESALDLYNDP